MVAAHIQKKQAAFDETQPLPAAATLWVAERSARQSRGELPPCGSGGAGSHIAPRYIQVYVDDFNGSQQRSSRRLRGHAVSMERRRTHVPAATHRLP